MMRAALAALRSPFYRREMWNYAKWAVRNRKVMAAARRFARGLAESSPSMKYPKWASAADPEIAFRKYRFEWINRPRIGSEADALIVLDEICAWINRHPRGQDAEGWDAYSASRRVANWVMALSVLDGYARGYAPIRQVEASLSEHADFISRNLEFRGAATNNHMMANGAALYLAGVQLKSDLYLEMGRKIIRTCRQIMFYPDGFLKENSSHYHLLACRTMIEVVASANKMNDHPFVSECHEHLGNMLVGAAFLREIEPLPHFGDVSPDMEPSNVLASVERFMAETAEMDCLRVLAFPPSGHYRLKNRRWKVVFYANPLGCVIPGAHGHDDLLSFNLYHDGRPVLADPGNSTYTDGPMGRFWRSFRAHNTVAIDGMGPSVVHAHNAHIPLLLEEYCASPPKVMGGYNGDFVAAEIHCGGYGRVGHKLGVTRYIFMGDDRVVIEDHIKGSGKHSAEWFFHLHPLSSVRSGEFSIDASGDEAIGTKRRIFYGHEGRWPMGWHSPNYGTCVPTESVVFSERLRLPAYRRFVLKYMG